MTPPQEKLSAKPPAGAGATPPEDAAGKKPGGSTLFAVLVFGIPLVLMVLLAFLMRD